MIAVTWVVGLFLAVGGGTQPGYMSPVVGYPTTGVAIVVGVISAESWLLYALLLTRAGAGSLQRLVIAEIVFLMLFAMLGAAQPTDMPGYLYANGRFLLLVNLALVFSMIARTVVMFLQDVNWRSASSGFWRMR